MKKENKMKLDLINTLSNPNVVISDIISSNSTRLNGVSYYAITLYNSENDKCKTK